MGAERDASPVAAPADVSPATDLFVIQNPAAGPRRPDRLRRRIEAMLTARGVQYDLVYTTEPGHAAELAKRALDDGFDRLVVVGGDGTVLETVTSIAGRNASVAVLPVGTGNQLAANLGVPRNLRTAVEIAVNGRPRVIDVGLMNGRPFSSIAGAGFDAEIVRPDSKTKRRLGYLAYVYSALREASSPTTADFRIRVDGEEIRGRGVGVEVTNMPGLTAPGLPRPVPIVPDGAMDDGKLDGCLLTAETSLECVKALGSIIARRYDESNLLVYFKGREIEVETDPPLRVQADGERLGTTPFTAGVWRAALRVMVPRGQAAS